MFDTSETPSSTKLITSISQLSGTITELSTFFYGFQSQQLWRVDIIAQGLIFKQTVVAATMEAEGGQAIARRIVYLLNKGKKSPSSDILEDLLETLQEKIEAHLTLAKKVLSGFTEVQSGLIQIYEKSTYTDKFKKHQVATQASGIIDVMCEGICDVVDILTQHVDFWSDLSARIAAQLVELTPEKLIKNNGHITIGIAEESEEEWSKIEALYQQYASTARLSKQVLDA